MFIKNIKSLTRMIGTGLRFQNSFDDATVVHGIERLTPLVEGPEPANQRFYVEATGGKQTKDRFPDGPVMAEAPFECDVLLHQRI